MPASRTVFVAGAGIGGLTAALSLAAKGFRVVVAEHAERLEEVGAGLQISPNASRVLVELGLERRLREVAIALEAVSVRSARSGREIVNLPLGENAAFRYGSPYWVIHRADLQGVLAEAALNHPDIELRLGTHCEDVAVHAHGATVVLRKDAERTHEPALALIGADGVWSTVRRMIAPKAQPTFSGRTAWRGVIDATLVPREFSAPRVQLWLGANAHLVVYPMKGGRRINIVAVVADSWNRPGWSEAGDRTTIMEKFAAPGWHGAARLIVGAVEDWKRWALFSLPHPPAMAQGPVALVGDSAHAMVPFLAQGSAMAIEDAAVLALCMADQPRDIAGALSRYDALRHARVTRVARAAAQTGKIYHLSGAAAFARDTTMRLLGGRKLVARMDWIYDWRMM